MNGFRVLNPMDYPEEQRREMISEVMKFHINNILGVEKMEKYWPRVEEKIDVIRELQDILSMVQDRLNKVEREVRKLSKGMGETENV